MQSNIYNCQKLKYFLLFDHIDWCNQKHQKVPLNIIKIQKLEGKKSLDTWSHSWIPVVNSWIPEVRSKKYLWQLPLIFHFHLDLSPSSFVLKILIEISLFRIRVLQKSLNTEINRFNKNFQKVSKKHMHLQFRNTKLNISHCDVKYLRIIQES